MGRILGKRLFEPRVPGGVRVRRGRWVPWLGGVLSGTGRPVAAVTLGRTIVVHTEARLTERLLRHELAHVRQWRSDPLLFPLRYVREHLKHGYRNNPYEVEARRAEGGGESAAGTHRPPTSSPRSVA